MKRIQILTLAVLSLVALALLTSCGCDHEEILIPAVAATCTESGLTEGAYCNLCGDILKEQTTVPAKGHTEVTKNGKDATCTESGLTEGKYCSDCGTVFAAQETIPALGHTTASGTCSRCGRDIGDWQIGYYVDEFEQPTTDAYVTNKSYILGKFSNSATTDSKLYAQILVDADDVSIFLYEYGRSQVKNNSSKYSDDYEITMKTSDGTKTTLSASIYPGGDRLMIAAKDQTAILNALKSGGTISFYIVESDYPTTNYLFSLESSNFADLYQKIK